MTDRYVVVGRSDHPLIRSKLLLIDSMFAAQALQSMEEGSIERRFDGYERAGHKVARRRSTNSFGRSSTSYAAECHEGRSWQLPLRLHHMIVAEER